MTITHEAAPEIKSEGGGYSPRFRIRFDEFMTTFAEFREANDRRLARDRDGARAPTP
jgi:hypothetical protein